MNLRAAVHAVHSRIQSVDVDPLLNRFGKGAHRISPTIADGDDREDPMEAERRKRERAQFVDDGEYLQFVVRRAVERADTSA